MIVYGKVKKTPYGDYKATCRVDGVFIESMAIYGDTRKDCEASVKKETDRSAQIEAERE